MPDAEDAATREGTVSAAEFAVDAARAGAGALIFSLPILMTMEMWHLGFLVDPLRLALLFALLPPLLVGLSRVGGFRQTATLRDDVADAFVAVAIALLVALGVLGLFGQVGPRVPLHDTLGKVMMQAVPGSIGAMLAQNQLDADAARGERARIEQTYGGEVFLMVVGALFLSLSVAPTDEVVVIVHHTNVRHELAMIALTLVLMHAMVYALEFRGSAPRPARRGFWTLLARYTVVGYAAVLLVSLYLLWTFGRLDGLAAEEALSMVVVVSLPGGVGAAVARVIL